MFEEIKNNIKKTENGYEFMVGDNKVIITKKELTDEILDYAIKFANYYEENKDDVNNHIYNYFKEEEWYVNEYSKEEIIERIGTPVLYVSNVNFANITYLESTLDEHIINVEVANEFMLAYVTVEG